MSPELARSSLTDRVLGVRLSEEDTREHQQAIARGLLAGSRFVKEANFTAIHPEDLEYLFAAYDERFLDRLCRHALNGRRLTFTLSSRMTKSGGITKFIRTRGGEERFEIAIASGILFDGFTESARRTTVCGIECESRLEALQRIFEHELIHLAEQLCWRNSNCAAPRFQEIAARLFLHRAHTHNLITRREVAAESGIRRGTMVSFEFEGRRLSGRVARITQRATVLVEDAGGARYTDGKYYRRYYVPLGALKQCAVGS
jgi:hypothetical protein